MLSSTHIDRFFLFKVLKLIVPVPMSSLWSRFEKRQGPYVLVKRSAAIVHKAHGFVLMSWEVNST